MTGTRRPPEQTVLDRVLERIELDENGCWIWPGSRSPLGYGRINVGNHRVAFVHRVTYEHFRGALPGDLEIDHLCRVPACCNPWHLDAVTHRENLMRGQSPAILSHHSGECKRGHSLADAYRDVNGRVKYCRTCRAEKRRAGEWR